MQILKIYTKKHPPEALNRKSVLQNFAKFTAKHLYQSHCVKSVQIVPRSATLLKKRHRHNCSLVNFAKLLRTPLLQSTSRRLLLYIVQVFNYRLNKICGSQLQKHGNYHTTKEDYHDVQIYWIRLILTFKKSTHKKILPSKCNEERLNNKLRKAIKAASYKTF